ncbi:hypothetical protein ACFQFH_19970 [Halobaculum halobium]|uniref:Uncharacterized protein n=1 Tax=Halobaculum halobium TaxID=3032281 RepID=A0ABD5TEZ1_9EURY|nr:hypothetical protein [Halobaculum sp. SYNS20]
MSAETPAYVSDGLVVDHHDPHEFIIRCPSCGRQGSRGDRPGENDRRCSRCNRIMGVTPVRPQRSGWAADAAREEEVRP